MLTILPWVLTAQELGAIAGVNFSLFNLDKGVDAVFHLKSVQRTGLDAGRLINDCAFQSNSYLTSGGTDLYLLWVQVFRSIFDLGLI